VCSYEKVPFVIGIAIAGDFIMVGAVGSCREACVHRAPGGARGAARAAARKGRSAGLIEGGCAVIAGDLVEVRA
jgi:hypothetical protein